MNGVFTKIGYVIEQTKLLTKLILLRKNQWKIFKMLQFSIVRDFVDDWVLCL